MRSVNYKVVRADGSKFDTTSYSEATNGGNRILETYLTEICGKTEKEREAARKHALKVQEILKTKRN